MVLNNIKKDDGKKLGVVKTPDFNKLYRKYNSKFLSLLIVKIKTNNIFIADYGGGNCILTRDLLKMLDKRKIKVKIENIDYDKSKFVKINGIKNIHKDILKYKQKEKYDFATCRFVIHYLSDKQQTKFLNNIYASLKPKGFLLLINFITSGKEHKIKLKIEKFLKKYVLIKRNMPTEKKILHSVSKSKFKIVQIKKVSYNLSISDFYKNRFNLSKQQVKDLIKFVGRDKHKESQIAILLLKE